MRKDVILGMSIGGVVLAVLIVYLTISPSGKKDKHAGQVEIGLNDGSGGAGDIGAGTEANADNSAGASTSSAGNTHNGGKKPTTPAKDAPAKKDEPKKDEPAKPATNDASRVLVQANNPKAPEQKPADKPAADEEKPQILAATNVEKSDPKWGDKLWPGGTPLIGVSETPDPNAKTAELLENAAAGDQSSVSKSTLVVPRGPGPVVVPQSPDHPSNPSTPNTTPKPTDTGSSTTGAKPAATVGTHQHTVTQGETLSTIARVAYGDANLYPAIKRANPTLDERKLRPGTVINLPDISEVKPPANEEKAADKSADKTTEATTASHKPDISTPAVDPKTEYRVVAGDSLHKISQKLYGKSDQVQKIYELNKSAIGADPAKLKLGMVLKLPEPPTNGAK